MNSGDVVIASVPQSDGMIKHRPAIALRQLPGFGDWLVCGISTQHRQLVKDFDEMIAAGDADFESAGLRETSVIRLSFLGVVDRTRVAGTIGSISIERHHRLVERLAKYLLGDLQL